MRKSAFILVLAMAIGFNSYGQFYFGVNPGLTSNSANFGYKVGNFVPYAALQLVSGSATYDYSSRYWDSYDERWYTYTDNESASVNLILPTLGVKYFFIESNDLKAYANLSLSKAFLTGKMKDDGTIVEEFGDALKDINIFGAEVGFGVEYFLSSNFSIGGEYALRYLKGSSKSVHEYEYGGHIDKTTISSSINVAPTVAKFSLNFYFGKE